MIKITNKQFNETYYEDQCDNGLNIVVWHKPDYATTSCLFATPYGSLDIEQIDDEGNHIHHPPGIAHFLEHKLFESDHGDVMSEFSKLGANVNAFTSYRETVYYFDTSDEKIEKPLNLLLDFVQNLQISDESVEKEKGIICQELMMYLEMPDSRLIFETFKSLYKNHPLKFDIGGNVDSVNKTTKQNLEKCYELNYHPANMTVIVVTPTTPETVIKLIKDNQANKSFKPYHPVYRYLAKEPKEVFEKEKTILMDVTNHKVALGIKLPVLNESDRDRVKRDWALRFILESYFTASNSLYQEWLDEKHISHYFGYEEDLSKDYALILFYDEGVDENDFKLFIERECNNLKKQVMKESQLKQLKNRSLGEALCIFNRPEEISIQYFRDQLNGVKLFDTIQIIQSLTIQDCQEIIKDLDLSSICRVIIKSA